MQSPVFVGQREEAASLAALLDRARAGEPGFAIVVGEAGVGKTRLVAELTGRADGSGFAVLTGHCVELGAEGTPLINALRTLARTTPPGELAEVLGTLAGRASRSAHPRWILAAALAAAGLPMPLLAVTRWPAVAIVLTGLTGAGALLVEILTETCLQRMLDKDMFGRAYGLALPASLAGIVAGSLLAPVLTTALGGPGALVAAGAAVLAYALLVLHSTSRVAGTLPALQAT